MSDKKVLVFVTASFLMALLLTCGGEAGKSGGSSEEAIFAQQMCDALLNGNEEEFVQLHLAPGDTTPDGGGVLMTDRGGRPPNDASTENVKGAFIRALRQMEELEKMAGEISCGGFLTASGRVETMDQYLKEILFEVHGEEYRYALKLGSSRLSQRGRVLVGDPGISVLYWIDYQEDYGQ